MIRSASLNAIGNGYFGALAIPLGAGREFTERDGLVAPKVATAAAAHPPANGVLAREEAPHEGLVDDLRSE